LATTNELRIDITVNTNQIELARKELKRLGESLPVNEFERLRENILKTSNSLNPLIDKFNDLIEAGDNTASKIEKVFFAKLQSGFDKLQNKINDIKNSMASLQQTKGEISVEEPSPTGKLISGISKDVKDSFSNGLDTKSLAFGLVGLLSAIGAVLTGFDKLKSTICR